MKLKWIQFQIEFINFCIEIKTQKKLKKKLLFAIIAFEI